MVLVMVPLGMLWRVTTVPVQVPRKDFGTAGSPGRESPGDGVCPLPGGFAAASLPLSSPWPGSSWKTNAAVVAAASAPATDRTSVQLIRRRPDVPPPRAPLRVRRRSLGGAAGSGGFGGCVGTEPAAGQEGGEGYAG